MDGWYAVSTREVEMSPGGWYEPPEYGRYFVYARAKSAKRAKVIALRWMRHHGGYNFQAYFTRDCASPFTGMIAERICQYSDRPWAKVGPEGGTEWLCDCPQCNDCRAAEQGEP